MNYSTDNTRIIDRRKVPAPYELVNKYPINDDIAKLVYGTRNQVSQILHDKDDRIFVLVDLLLELLSRPEVSPRSPIHHQPLPSHLM